MPITVANTRKSKSKSKNRNIKTLKLRARLYNLLFTNPDEFQRIIDKLTKKELNLVYGEFQGLRLINKTS